MSKILLLSVSLLALAGQAHAFSYFSVGGIVGPAHGDPGPARGQTTVVTFAKGTASGVLPKAGVTTTIGKGITETVTGNVGLYTGNAYVDGGEIAAAPPGDKSQYASIGPDGMIKFDFTGYEKTHKINSLSLYDGSVDAADTMVFLNKSGGKLATIHGTQLPAYDGDQGASITNRRFYFTFGPHDNFASIELTTNQYAFEFANIAVGPARFDNIGWGGISFDTPLPTGDSPVPEPAAWWAMLIGFSLVGVTLRRRATTVTA